MIGPWFSMGFLGSALNSVLVYIWSRKNPDTNLSFLGLVVFKAPFLPWVLALFSMAVHGSVPKDDLCGIIIGHCKDLLANCLCASNVGSVVLFQRRLPSDEPRLSSSGSALVVDPPVGRPASE